jgi:hypothetical protein
MMAALALALVAGSAVQHAGLSDASAGIALDDLHFVVANDEHNRLVVYRRGVPAPLREVDLGGFLGAKKEADLEGAARIDRRIYWIASHARNAQGKRREDRQRFFATDIVTGAGLPTLAPAGIPYSRLLDDLTASPVLAGLKLGDAAAHAPETEGGFNIEGLAEGPNGSLLIGLRNPLRQGRALLIPLLNPAELVVPGGGPARFGEAIALDLQALGVRSLERLVDGSYLIAAGRPGDGGSFRLFHWQGTAGQAPRALRLDLRDLRPEGLFLWPDGRLTLLSDDGALHKHRPEAEQRFRAVELSR